MCSMSCALTRCDCARRVCALQLPRHRPVWVPGGLSSSAQRSQVEAEEDAQDGDGLRGVVAVADCDAHPRRNGGHGQYARFLQQPSAGAERHEAQREVHVLPRGRASAMQNKHAPSTNVRSLHALSATLFWCRKMPKAGSSTQMNRSSALRVSMKGRTALPRVTTGAGSPGAAARLKHGIAAAKDSGLGPREASARK